MKDGEGVTNIHIDMRTSTIKPVHGKWILKVMADLKTRQDMLKSAFTNPGITEAVREARND